MKEKLRGVVELMNKLLHKRRTLKWSMVVMLIACWLLPLGVLTITILFLISAKFEGQIHNTIEISADNAVEICNLRLAEAMTASKQVSYDTTIKNSYEQYMKDGNQRELYQRVSLYLAQQFKYNTEFKSTILYFTEDPDTLYFTFSNMAGSTYESVKAFEKYAKKEIQEKAKELDTYQCFMRVNKRVYMVRNLVNSEFEAFGVLIMELNPEKFFGSLESVWAYQDAKVFVDGVLMLGEQTEDNFADRVAKRTRSSIYMEDRESSAVFRRDECDGHDISYIITLDHKQIIGEKNTIWILAAVFGVFMILLIVLGFQFFQKKVTRPIEQLIRAHEEIEKEHYGFHIEEDRRIEEEFYYLNETFNKMSDKLQYQFRKIYLEELALRDANIMALQSQINPHFLNNTLEVINWEARMTENYKVSGMIEALATMLEATMNRRQESKATLLEELNYVDAYLYIIQERYGDNFEVEKYVEENLMRVEIPRLIIQPIVENAVEHGMDIRQKGKVKLHIYSKDGFMHIDVWDNGILSERERERIRGILTQEDMTNMKHVSMGIRNVNKRLKIIYGEECGLTIGRDSDGHTVSTLLVKIGDVAQ